MMNRDEALRRWVTGRRGELTTFAQRLVRVPSVHGNETAVAKLIQARLARAGISSGLVGEDPQRKTLVASIGRGRRTLMLNGHLDTVPFGVEERWRFSPLSGEISGGRMYGRGTFDMKCSVAAATYAAIALKSLGRKLGGRLLLVFNFDEESGAHSGVKDALARGLTADAAICIEPMTARTIRIGARGIYRFELVTKGRTGHTGYKGSGVNAVTAIAPLLLALEKLVPKHRKHPLFDGSHVTPGTLIRGGVGINVYPDSCVAHVDCRLTLGQSLPGIRKDIRDCLRKAARKKIRYELRELAFSPPFLTEQEESIAALSRDVLRPILGFRPRAGTMGGTTDGNFLSAAGIPTVIFGVEGERAHTENENASVRSMVQMTEAYARVAELFLNGHV